MKGMNYMKKLKKVMALSLAAVTAAGMLAACGGGEDAQTAKSDKPELNILMNNIKEDPNTYPVSQMLEEKTGYHINYELLPSDNVAEKLNLVLSSQADYDGIQIMGTYKDKYYDYANQGALLELDELIDEYGPNIKEALSEGTWELSRVNGKIYGIVTASSKQYDENGEEVPSPMVSMMLVRTDIMKQAGIEKMPETIDEFTEMLRAMKGLSEGNMVQAPLTTYSTLEMPGIDGAFGVEREWVDNGDGTLVNRIETDGYKEYLLYLKSLYDEGLLDSELPTNKTNNVQEKFTSGKSYVMPMAYYDAATIMDALDNNCPGYEIEYMLPLTGADGKSGYAYGSSPLERVFVIPKTAKHPEDVIKWINAKLDKDTFKEMILGEEGVDYEVKDGAYYPILPAFDNDRGLANDFLTGSRESEYLDYWLCRVRKDDRIYQKYLETQDEKALSFARRNLDADAPTMAASKYTVTLNTIVNDYALGVITGAETIEGYDEFLNKWRTSGGDELKAEMNEWYSSNNA